MTVEPWQMNPYIRYMDKRTCSVSYRTPVMAYEYRLFAVCGGSCRLWIDGADMALKRESCVIFPPVMPYRFFFSEEAPAALYDVNFNLIFVKSAGIRLSPDPPEIFDRERMAAPPDDRLFRRPVLLENAAELCREIGELLIERERLGPYCDEMCSARLKAILIEALRLSEAARTVPDSLTENVCRYIEAHCRENVTAEELGRVFGYHPFYLNRLFGAKTGFTLHRYLLECRMKRACSMLAGTRLSVREIADSLGFSSPAYFAELFGKMRGMTPSAYRAEKTDDLPRIVRRGVFL